MESSPTQEKKYRRGVRLGAAILGLSALLTAGFIVSEHKDPEKAYTGRYTESGACLDNTPYDPSKGALVHVDSADGVDVLSVVPRDANWRKPPVLFFAIDRNGLSPPGLNPADYATGTFIDTRNCPGQPDGY